MKKTIKLLALAFAVALIAAMMAAPAFATTSTTEESMVSSIEIWTSLDDVCELSPGFDPAIKNYTVYVHDSVGQPYIKVNLSEANQDAIIECTSGSITYPLENGKRVGLGTKDLNGVPGKTITVKATKGEAEENYTLTTSTSKLTMSTLTLKDKEGAELQKFSKNTTPSTNDYDLYYVAGNDLSSITLTPACPSARASFYSFDIEGTTVKNKEEVEVPLGVDDKKVISIIVRGDGLERTGNYTLTVYKSCSLSFAVNVEGAAVTLNDGEGNALTPEEDGSYTILRGQTYTYTVSAEGYVTATKEITVSGNTIEEVTLLTEEEAAAQEQAAKETAFKAVTIGTISTKTYTGKALTPAVTVKAGNVILKKGTDYSVKYSNNTNAGKATVTLNGMGAYAGTRTVNFTINKAKNTMKVTAKGKTYKAKALKKKAKSFKAITVKNNKGSVTYKAKAVNAKSKKALKFKNGKIIVKKGTKKGTYKMRVTVTAKGNNNYLKGSVNKTLTVKVK